MIESLNEQNIRAGITRLDGLFNIKSIAEQDGA